MECQVRGKARFMPDSLACDAADQRARRSQTGRPSAGPSGRTLPAVHRPPTGGKGGWGGRLEVPHLWREGHRLELGDPPLGEGGAVVDVLQVAHSGGGMRWTLVRRVLSCLDAAPLRQCRQMASRACWSLLLLLHPVAPAPCRPPGSLPGPRSRQTRSGAPAGGGRAAALHVAPPGAARPPGSRGRQWEGVHESGGGRWRG